MLPLSTVTGGDHGAGHLPGLSRRECGQTGWLGVVCRELDSEIACTPLNTLSVHLFVALSAYSVGCCQEMIRIVFKAVPERDFISLIVPSRTSLGSTRITVCDQVGNLPSLTDEEDFAVHVRPRPSQDPQLPVRRARVEDHGDLTPAFMHHGTVPRSTCGDHFLAELTEAQDEENHTVVWEVVQLLGS